MQALSYNDNSLCNLSVVCVTLKGIKLGSYLPLLLFFIFSSRHIKSHSIINHLTTHHTQPNHALLHFSPRYISHIHDFNNCSTSDAHRRSRTSSMQAHQCLHRKGMPKLHTYSSFKQAANTPKFDALAPGATPTPGFGGVNWSGFTVDTSSKYGVNATSGKQVARLPNEAATINGLFQLNSFTFACIASIDLSSYFPNGCSLQLVIIPAAAHGSITTLGPYTYNPGDISSQGSANMTKVVLDNVPATSTVYWNVVAGAGDGQLLVDNVVVTTQNSCPA
jgi:hypothetical protein